MSAFYGPPTSEEAGVAVIRRALELGCTTFDTAELYNVGADIPANNEKLLGAPPSLQTLRAAPF